MTLHPMFVALLDQWQGRPAMSDGSPETARDMLSQSNEVLGAGPAMVSVQDIAIPTGHETMKARLLIPGPEPSGIIVYVHGGGWVIGSLEDFDSFTRALAEESGCAVLAPDYRLAPEHPFPAPLEDVEAALLFAQQEMAALVGRRLPLIAAGDSAGGNLVTVAARRLKDRLDLALQVLIYPVTDCDFTRPSYAAHGQDYPLKAADMRWFFNHYAPEELWTSPDISPLRASDLAGLPPTVITTAEYDVLLDEGEAYAARLRAEGVDVIERRVPGVIHGYARFHNLLDTARDELLAVAADIRQVLQAQGAKA